MDDSGKLFDRAVRAERGEREWCCSVVGESAVDEWWSSVRSVRRGEFVLWNVC